MSLDTRLIPGQLLNAVINSRLGGNCRIMADGIVMSDEVTIKPSFGTVGNPLSSKPDPVTYINNSENTLIDIEIARGNIFDFQTVAGQTYNLVMEHH